MNTMTLDELCTTSLKQNEETTIFHAINTFCLYLKKEKKPNSTLFGLPRASVSPPCGSLHPAQISPSGEAQYRKLSSTP